MYRRQLRRAFPSLVYVVRLARRMVGITLRTISPRPTMKRSGKTVDVSGLRNIWCGYYDHSPFRPENENVVLVHATNWYAWRKPNPSHPAKLLLVDWCSNQVVEEVGTTYAWNWQQGARAHWLSKDVIIYNIYDQKRDSYFATLSRLGSKGREVLPLPVQETDKNGRIYSISYEALNRIRPDYGYRNKKCTEQDILENRIRSYDLRSGMITEYVGVSDLLVEAGERNRGAISLPKLNHLMASPSGINLVFLFRYFVDNRRVTDLYNLEVSSGKWWCVVPDGGASHCHWLDDETILVTMRGLRGFGYYQVDVKSGNSQLIWKHADGHPSSISRQGFITDTYPDERAMRRLLIVPWLNPMAACEIAAFPEPLLVQGETRCDLHPAISQSSKWVQVDMMQGHRRTIGILAASGCEVL